MRLSSLTNKLLVRVANYFDTQVRVPLSDSAADGGSGSGTETNSKAGPNKGKNKNQETVNTTHKMSDSQIITWYSKILDSVRFRHRKLQRFAR